MQSIGRSNHLRYTGTIMTENNSKAETNAIQSKTDKFIQKAKTIHGDRYDYSETFITGSRNEPVLIICKEHGKFTQRKDAHLRGQNCKKCAYAEMSVTRSSTRAEFIEKCLSVHGDKYDYSQIIDSILLDGKVEIICSKHGVFLQRRDVHLRGGGCPSCSGNKKHSIKTFVDKSRKVHGFKYDYSNSIYINNETKLDIVCPRHGLFSQQPNSHFNGSGCPVCDQEMDSGHSRSVYLERCAANHNGLANLYIIKCSGTDEEFYKIGITSLTLKQRFNKGTLPYNYKTLVFFQAEAGFIWDLEKQLHRLLSAYKYDPVKKFHGRFECFSSIPKDIYKLIENLDSAAQMQLIA